MNLNFLQIIDILRTLAFAVSGAFSAMEKKLDPFGVLVLAFVTAIGGVLCVICLLETCL